MCRWTPAEDAYLTQHVAEPHVSLAASLGRSRLAVANRIGTLGLRWRGKKRRASPEEEATLCRMYRAGSSDRQIALCLGVNRLRVRRWRVRLGLPSIRIRSKRLPDWRETVLRVYP